jgi:glycosyltransferase involved in cell wall biosynthesis
VTRWVIIIKNSEIQTRATIIIRTEGLRTHLLSRALESVASQTYDALETIVVHDGGDVSSSDYVQVVALASKNSSYLPIGKAGRCEAGNVGIRAAKGEYVGFLDDDDFLLPKHVESLVEVLDHSPETICAYALSKENRVKGNGSQVRWPTRRKPVGIVPFSKARLWMENYLPIQSVMTRRKALLEVEGFDPTLTALEDWDLWVRLSSIGAFSGIDEVTSVFFVPADKQILKNRAQLHEAHQKVLAEKHLELSTGFKFNEFRQLRQILSEETDDWISARSAFARIWRRLFYGW